MHELEEMIDLINKYLLSQLEPMSLIDFFIQYILPIIQLSIIVGGAIAGLYKYFKSKNREIYQQLLSEVYSPLYQYFVKQELLRNIMNLKDDYHEKPVLEYTVTATTNVDPISGESTITKKTLLGLNRRELIKVLDSINIGLASKELYTLLSMYKVLVCLEETNANDTDKIKKIVEVRKLVETKLRKEIMLGYEKYHKKLRIKSGMKNDFFKLNDSQIFFQF